MTCRSNCGKPRVRVVMKWRDECGDQFSWESKFWSHGGCETPWMKMTCDQMRSEGVSRDGLDRPTTPTQPHHQHTLVQTTATHDTLSHQHQLHHQQHTTNSTNTNSTTNNHTNNTDTHKIACDVSQTNLGKRAKSQQIVVQRLLSCLQHPVPY